MSQRRFLETTPGKEPFWKKYNELIEKHHDKLPIFKKNKV